MKPVSSLFILFTGVLPRTVAFAVLCLGCTLLAFLAAPSAHASAHPSAAQPKNVLVLHSYHTTMEWDAAIDQGITETFRDASMPVNLRFEYMDTKRTYDKNYLGLLLDTYRHKFAKKQFDAILSSDNNALEFLVRHGEELFPGVPVVFCGVNYFQDEMLQGKPGFTGAVEQPAFGDTLELALKLTPNVRHVYVFGSDTPTYFANKALISEVMPHFQNRLEFHFIEGEPMEEVEARISTLPRDAMVLQIAYLREAEGKLLSFQESTNRISQAAGIPFYGTWDAQLPHGIIGGKVISGQAQGRAAAQLVLRILGKKAVEEIPVLRESPNQYIFDYAQLQRFGIDESALPPGSTILNRPASLLEKHGYILIPAAVVVAILAFAVVILIITIGKRKKAEQRALRSERLYRSIFDNAVEGIFQSTLEGRFLRVNPAMAHIYGYDSPEEMVASVIDIAAQLYVDPVDRERLLALLDLEGSVTGMETRHRRKNGEIIWIGHTVTRTFDPDRGEYNFEGIVEDITARKEAETVLERWKHIFQHAKSGIIVVKGETTEIELHNPALARMYGYSEEEIAKLSISDLFAPEEHPRIPGFIHAACELGHHRVDSLHIRKDGSRFPVLIDISVVKDSQGNVLYRIGNVLDITEQQKAQDTILRESTLNKAQAEISRALTQPASTVKEISSVVHMWGMKITGSEYGCVFSRSPSIQAARVEDASLLMKKCPYQERQGQCPDPVCGQKNLLQAILDFQTGMYANTPDAFQASLGILSPDPIQQLLTVPAMYMGVHVGQITVCNPGRDFNDSDLRAITALADLFALAIHRMQSEKEMLLSREKAEAANKAKSEFLANMSHELRTPINGALGMLQLLDETKHSDEQAEYIHAGIRSCRNLTRLLHDILDLSRVEAGMLSLHEESFDIHELINSVRSTFMDLVREKGIGFETHVAEDVPQYLTGDPVRIRQVLFNLAGNAVKFTEQGEVSMKVLRVSTSGSGLVRLCFTVSDTGIGIPEDFRKNIFESFTQVEEAYARQRQGAGLGLAIVKRLATLMGGVVEFTSLEGHGSTFRVELSLKTVPSLSSHSTPLPAPSPALSPVSKRILLAEDDASNRLMLQTLLTKHGFDVTSVEDGKKAVEALEQSAFDCVLMDIQMPKMDGVTATKAIRTSTELGDKAQTPIVAITAYAMEGDREAFLDMGMNEYLSKPVELQELLQLLRRLCP